MSGVDKMQKDTAVEPEKHLKDVDGAIAAAAKANPAAAAAAGLGADGSGSGADQTFDAVAAAVVEGAGVAGFAASVFITAGDGMEGGGNGPGGAKNNKKNNEHRKGHSVFLSGAKPGKGSQFFQQAKRTSLVPMSYAQKKLAGKLSRKAGKGGNVFGRACIASMSLTGSDTATALKGGKSGLPRGMKGLNKATKVLSELIKERNVTKHLMQGLNRFDSGKRLFAELKKGVDSAEKAVRRNPNLVDKLQSPKA